jgi:hypothetical protein
LRAALAARSADGLALRLKANYWAAFVINALRVLAPGGSLCMVLPAAWDYADYSAPFRTKLPLRFRTFEVYRAREPLFGPVQDGCVVVLGREFGGAPSTSQRFELDTTADLVASLRAAGRRTRSAGAVVYLPNSRPPVAEAPPKRPFSEAFDLRIGAVTGDASFFLLTEQERLSRGLPVGAVHRCLTRSSHLSTAEATAMGWEALRDAGARVWLFRPPPRLLSHPAVAAFMKLPHARGGCDRTRFKVSHRERWYRPELPAGVDAFLSGMSRVGPWICLRRDPRLTATNTLYTLRFRLADTWEERAAWAMSLFAPEVRRQLVTAGRRYPDGLLKYEPGDLYNLVLPVPPRVRGALGIYRKMVSAFLAHDRGRFDDLTSKWFGGPADDGPAVPLRLASG